MHAVGVAATLLHSCHRPMSNPQSSLVSSDLGKSPARWVSLQALLAGLKISPATQGKDLCSQSQKRFLKLILVTACNFVTVTSVECMQLQSLTEPVYICRHNIPKQTSKSLLLLVMLVSASQPRSACWLARVSSHANDISLLTVDARHLLHFSRAHALSLNCT